MAQVTFVADNIAGTGEDNATGLTVTKPTGTTDGDLLITILNSNNGTTITTLTGWTLLDSTSDNDAGQMSVYWKIASSEGADYTWAFTSIGATGAMNIHVSAWRNTHQTSPLEIYAKTNDTTVDTTSTGTGVTTTTAPHGVLLQAHGFRNAAASFSGYAVANNNPSWTEIEDNTSSNQDAGTGQITTGIAYATYDLAQATGNATATISQTGESSVFLMFIKPAGFTFAPPVMSMTGTFVAPAIAAAITAAAMTASFTTYAPTVATADPTIQNVDKNTASFTNTAKNSVTFTNTPKNSSGWTNTPKS